MGMLKLAVPRDRNGEFSTALFERSQRGEKALVGALALSPCGSRFYGYPLAPLLPHNLARIHLFLHLADHHAELVR